ncbi:prepilin-type N-terminal cleavage/methylation domain-containing protein [Lysinibacillus capsici]|uniref:prepilin-type N-terminal cleavage/methylation domain-containing protein n=1 Tax=Lysinibacillus capsici TaxID=2115968 RepID=UPI0029DE8034|nr:prepilin-type N-terminal cleavage/methylation domain-containing protein [Lysinibacillus capsici]WPK06601.1 prepilin-type N-terminal cleavage/methylation domain-containing protein [Lysinibacillus capsici]
MLKKWKNKKLLKNEKGLTLVELLAVIVILAIIAAIAVPAIGNIINKSKDRAILAEASNILAGAKIAYIDGACDNNGTCGATALQPFVDGVDLTGTSVTFASNKWTITYPNLDKMKTNLKTESTTITEADLNAKLKSAGVEPEPAGGKGGEEEKD